MAALDVERPHVTPRTPLDRDWLIALDPDDSGRAAGWESAVPDGAVPASVPGVLQESFPGRHGLVWYFHDLPEAAPLPPGERYELRFDEVGYAATVWLDGGLLGGHAGAGAFAFDVTPRLSAPGSHLLAVRVLNPTNERIDGLVLAEVPHGNAALEGDFWPGRGYSYGGLTGPVELRHRRPVEVVEVWTRPDLATGLVEVDVTVENGTDEPRDVVLQASVAERTSQVEAAAPPGTSTQHLTLQVDDPRPWSPDNPTCYDLTVLLSAPESQVWHQRVGFRDFSVGADGTFRLNGRRCYVRSTHTGNHTPRGIGPERTAALLRRDLVHAKAIGLNMVRFIAGPATPEQLDLCDELGLLVYEETRAAWLLEPSPHSSDRFDHELRELVRRDRNHPSVVVWGLLNETGPDAVFRHAVESLQLVRDLDPTRLVLLGSGRWDGERAIGSVANPGSREWQTVWGEEGPDEASSEQHVRGYVEGVGDRHFYPPVPQDADADRRLRTMGTKPVFLSEYGIGSLFDAVTELRALEQAGAALDTAEPALMRRMLEGYLADWERFGLDAAYAFPEDLLRDSYRWHSEHRARGLDLIRANPAINGHNITGMLDHAVTGEGLWTFDRRWKPGIVEAVSEGLAPVRWCVFVTPRHGHRGDPARIEVVLANDSSLPPGEYEADVRVMGATGWRRSVPFRVEADGPYAVPVLDEVVPLDEVGEHRVAVSVRGPAAPTGGRLTFWRTDVPGLTEPVAVDAVGLGAATQAWLQDHGVDVHAGAGGRGVLLVGPEAEEPGRPDQPDWAAVRAAVEGGLRVVVLSPHRSGAALGALLGDAVSVHDCDEWLYHAECVGLDRPLFAGLPTNGILDWYVYGQTMPRHVLHGDPDEHAAVSVCVGNPGPGGYRSGYVAATWHLGQGSVTASTFQVLENLEVNPAAGLLLLNLVRAATSGSTPGTKRQEEAR